MQILRPSFKKEIDCLGRFTVVPRSACRFRTCRSLSVLQANASTATLPESTLSDGKALKCVKKSLEEERGVILHKSAHNSQIIFNPRGWYSACAINITLGPSPLATTVYPVKPVTQPPPTQPTCKALSQESSREPGASLRYHGVGALTDTFLLVHGVVNIGDTSLAQYASCSRQRHLDKIHWQ